MIESDVIEAVVALGRNLFYNSGMESCLVIARTNKPIDRKKKVLFINAVDEIIEGKTISHLGEEHIQRINNAYHKFQDEEGFSKVIPVEEILTNRASLNVPGYITKYTIKAHNEEANSIITEWVSSSEKLRDNLNALIETLKA